jgi:hypothetical protein
VVIAPSFVRPQVFVAATTAGTPGCKPGCAPAAIGALGCFRLNGIPFDYEPWPSSPCQALSFAGMYVALVVPFFLAGLVFTLLFSANATSIRSLYFWDLTGAAVGCASRCPAGP